MFLFLGSVDPKSDTQANTPNSVGNGNKNGDSGEKARKKSFQTSFTNFLKASMVIWLKCKEKK